MIDPDKKVEEIKKERPGLYQSTQHPEHFENEGGEYIEKYSEIHTEQENFPTGEEDMVNPKPKKDKKKGII